jgi:uncharacterized protein (DUF1684 family)
LAFDSARFSAAISIMKTVLAFVTLLGLAAVAHADDAAYTKEVETWRAQRVARLSTPDGWLSLIGLHFLKDGDNTVGSAKDNDVVLAKGPAHFGKVSVAADGKITVALAADSDGKIDGKPAMAGELAWRGGGRPSVVSAGTVSFFVIERGGKKALRVKDSASERRTHFLGIDYFPIDPAWRIEAQWVEFDEPRRIPITNILGQTEPAIVHGKAVFERDGQKIELLPIDEGPGEPLFFVISDATSGKETYGAARFLYADAPVDGKVTLDFNRVQNPPCAFTPFATCPLPPKENRLAFAVAAGEKNYRGGHE